MQRKYDFFFSSGAISILIHVSIFALLIGFGLKSPAVRHGSIQVGIIGFAKSHRLPQAAVNAAPKAPAQTLVQKKSPSNPVGAVASKSLAPSTPAGSQTNSDNGMPTPAEDFEVTQMPELADEIRIPYPTDSRNKEIQGAVVMDLLIDSLGRVRDAQLIEGPAQDLDEAALDAVKRFHFKPALIREQPVAVRIRYAYRFVIER